MNQLKFKKGDWCFCEFTLKQIMDTEENRITSVSDGMFTMGGNDISDRCFPLNMQIKRCSDSVAYWSKMFHELNHNSINHPDLNRELIRRWVEICENVKDDKVVSTLIDKLSQFGNNVVSKIRGLKYDEVEGVRLFR